MKKIYNPFKSTWFFIAISILTAAYSFAQEWYNSDWQYRREVSINNAGGVDLSDFQVQIVLDNSFDFSKTQIDGSDVRITDADGITPIPFWIELWDALGEQASIWIRIPNIPLSGTTVYVYYGNLIATGVSNGPATFEFFDDFESGSTLGYYFLGPPQNIMTQAQSWETSPPHTLSVVEAPAEAGYIYYGYYGLNDCGGIGMAGSNDLENWTKFPMSPAPPPNNPLFTGGGERWPHVYLDETSDTYYMVHTADYCGTSYVVYRESNDGLNWTPPTTLVPQETGNSNQNACLFRDPNDGLFYLYWRKRIGSPPNWIMVRSAPTVAELATATDIYLMNPAVSLSGPNMIYVDGIYFLATNYMDVVWKTRIYSSDFPTGPFTELPGNPVLTDGCACLFQTPFGTSIYEYYCKQNGSVWTMNMRTADMLAGRQTFGAIDTQKWTASGGTWSVPSVGQQDGSQGYVAQGTGVNSKDIQMSSYSGNDYVLEGYGKQVEGRVWGFGFRASGADGGNNYQLNIYEDLDGTQNMYLYNRTNFSGPFIWTTNLGQIDMDTWYKIKIKIYGDNFDIYFNDELKTLIPISNSQWTSGAVALYLEGGYTAQFNDVRVRQYASSEPSASIGDEENYFYGIDIGIENNSCGKFEVKLKPAEDISNNYLTNVQFTIRWPANTVNLINFETDFAVFQQGTIVIVNDTNYAIFVSTSSFPINWIAENDYTILSFEHDQSGSGVADFLIDDSDWATQNNGLYYVELLGTDQTGSIYLQAADVDLGFCGNLDLKVFLEGPYNVSTELMNATINSAGDLPLSHPYGGAPWNYPGAENVASMPANAVDWVLVELRDAPDAASATSATRIARQAALLLNDGTIQSVEGSAIEFNNATLQNLFVVLWHRNHLGILSAFPVTDSPVNFYNYDFSTAASQAYGNGQKLLDGGIYGMISGDANSDGIIDELDTDQIWSLQAGTSGYFNGDVDLNGQVNNPDKNDRWLQNLGEESQIPE